MSFVSTFVQRFLPTPQGEPPQVQIIYLPLPCPIHSCILVPEAHDNGEYRLYCPVCRLACQSIVQETESLTLKSVQERPSRPGALLHTMRAKNRFIERLSRQRLVLINFDANSRPQDTDALTFANALTEERPVVKDVG